MKARFPIRLLGTGSYAPETVRTNKHFTEYLDTSEEWILTRTGIRERRVAAPDETTSTMGVHAARRALEDAHLSIDDIDIIICATATGDHPFPATAAFIQGGLGGSRDIPAFDLGAACAGFLHATNVVAPMLTSGLYKTALIVGAETLTRFTDPEDRATAILLGDAAGAAVIGRSDDPTTGILYCELGCDGTRAEHIIVPAGGSRLPSSETTVAERLHFMRMRGREVFKFAVNKLQELTDRALEKTGLAPDDLKLIVQHQSNLRIIESARERLGLPKEKVVVNIDRYGNTSAASLIMGLDESRRAGLLEEGDIILLLALGGGLCWASMLVRV